MELNAELICHAAGVVRIFQAAAYLCPGYCIEFVDTKTHEQANDLIALFDEKVRGNTAVNAAAHGDNDFCFHVLKVTTDFTDDTD